VIVAVADAVRQMCLMFRKTVEKPTSPEGLRKLYENFLKHTTITSSKKLHLACRTMPMIMEDMGCVLVVAQERAAYLSNSWHHRVSMDQVDSIGHWAGNTRCEIYADKIPKNVGRPC
jgi:hypothetical protein